MKMAHTAALNRTFERIPGGHALRSLAQRALGRRRPAIRMPAYQWHRESALKYGAFDLEHATAYEFGAGKDLACPIVLWCYGVPRQIMVDREVLLDEALVARAMVAIAKIDDHTFRRRPRPRTRYRDMGIEYLAPADARRVPRPDGSVDLIVSNSTLEHIPPDDIALTMQECRRLCSPGAVVSVAINYADHYAERDKSIGVTHFLRYRTKSSSDSNPIFSTRTGYVTRTIGASSRASNFRSETSMWL